MMGGFASGFGYALRGLGMLRQPGIRRYVVVPLLVNTLLFAALLWYGLGAIGQLIDWLLSFLPELLDFLRYLLWPLFVLVALVLVFYTFTLVANLIAAPFNALLSEKVERRLTGAGPLGEGGLMPLIKGGWHALGSELRKLAYLVGWSVPLLLLFLIPVVNLIATPLWLAFGAWMLAIEYLDYPMGNRELGFREVREAARGRRALSLGFGSGMLLLTTVPVLNFLAMPAGVVGATALWVDRFGPAGPAPAVAPTE